MQYFIAHNTNKSMLKEGFLIRVKEKTTELGPLLKLLHMTSLHKRMVVKVIEHKQMEVLKLLIQKQLDVSEVFKPSNRTRISI